MNNLKVPLVHFLILFATISVAVAQDISTKGALIIASVEGQVTVINNESQQPLPASKIIAGGVIYDGHTIKTGPSSKMILLLTNGTVATIKADSSLNIKKFTQEKFDMSKTNFNDLKGEPSKSNTVIDIEIGDMVVDVKKLDKKSSFNIESPVGTAGIRGTVPAISVMQMPDGGFQQKTAMLRGEIAFTPRGGGLPTMLGPGQSLASGIGPNGVMLPMQFGQVSAAMMTAIQADVEAAGEAMGISVDTGPDASDANTPAAEEDAPSEDELNDSDDERKGASKGVGDDDNGTDAVALEKAGLIDLDNPEEASKADSFIEVATKSADSFGDKLEKEAEIAAKKSELDSDKAQLDELKLQRNSRRNGDSELSIEEQIAALENKISTAETEITSSESELGKDTSSFVEALSDNMASTVDVIIEAEALGVKSDDLITKTAENAENAPLTNSNLKKVRDAGVSDTDALAGLVSSPDKSDEAAEMLNDAESLGSGDAETFAALARNTDVADKMKEAKDSGTDVDSVLVAVKTTDSKKQVAKKKKEEAQKMREEVLSSGVEIPQNLISSIESAETEEALTLLLEENTGAVYYSQLLTLKASRSDILSAEAETLAADTAKTKIVDTSEYIGKVKEISAKKLEEANEQKAGLSDSIVAAIESAITIDSTEADITTIKSEYADDPNYQTIVSFVDNLKSSFDLDPAKMASGIVDNAETAADNLETITTAETLGVDPATIAQKPERAKEYKDITSQVSDDIESGAVGADLFTNLDTVADIVSVAKDKGLDTADLTKNVAKDAAVAVEMKEFVDQIDASGTTEDSETAFANIADAGNIIKKAKDSGVSTDDLAKDLAGDADVISDMKEFVDQIDTTGTAADSATAFANIADAGKIIQKAKASGVSTDDLAKDLAGDADVISDMKEFVDQIDTTGTAADSATAFANIADAGKIIQKAKASGLSTDDLAKDLAGDADIISSAKAAVDQLGDGVDNTSLFSNIVEVGGAVKMAKDLGVEDTALIKEMAENPDKAAKVNEVFAAVGSNIDADGAKNILGNVEDIDDTLTAISHAKESGADLKEFVKKDVEEHKALNEVVTELSKQGADAAAKFLEQGIEDALQLKQAFDDGHVDAASLANSVNSGETFSDAFKNSSLTKLNERFAGDADLLEALTLYQDKSKDILFALSFVAPGSSQETALMGNLDKLDSIMHLSHRFQEDVDKLGVVFANIDVVISLDALVTELAVFPARLDIVFANAELAPAILDTYQEYESTGAYDLIDQMFSSSKLLIDTISNDGLNKLLRDFPNYALEIENNRDRAGEISSLITQVGDQYAEDILLNLENFDDLNTMILRTKGDTTRIDALMLNIEALDEIKKLSDHYNEINLLGGQDVVFLNIVLFSQDPSYYDLALNSPKFFVKISEIAGDLNNVPSALALQLKDLDLNRDELNTVLSDLLAGPQVDGPTSAPPAQSSQQASSDTATLSFLMDHVIPSQEDETVDNVVFLNPNKVVDYGEASMSSFFQESTDLYFELMDLDSDDISASTNDAGYMGALEDSGYFVGGVFGGRNISFNQASYDLSNLESSNLLVAASGTLSLNGNLNFKSKLVTGESAELIFMSLEKLSISEGSEVSFAGDSLGFGSLDSIEVINVDLYAEGEVNMRSLDSLVINDSDMSTSGNGGADFVHLLAASELSIDNLRFSEQVRQIAMEAMTINLSNLNFPAGSTVQLNSLYGGMDGSYPNFGAKQYGRVNFIQNVQYNSNLINSRTTFDTHGGNISIGNLR
jgi:hypothetical protein